MKSLLIAHSYLPRVGGRELYLHHVFSRFSATDLVVLTPYEEGFQSFDRESPVKIVRMERERLFWFLRGRRGRLSWFAFLAHLCWREGIDIVHASLAISDGMSGWLLKRVLGKPYIVYTFGKELTLQPGDELKRKRLMQVFDQADRVVTISDYTRDQLLSLGVPATRIAKITPGVDTRRFYPDEAAGLAIRARYHLGDRPVILTIGRLAPHKGHDVVIGALPLVLSQIPNVVYLIGGKGPTLESLKALAQERAVSDHVIFAGYVPDEELPAFYNAADLFVMPSRQMLEAGEWEGFGIVYLEANACGKPVIGGRSGGTEDAVVNGQSGYLVDPESPEAVAEKILGLLQNPVRAQRMGEFGRRWVKQHLSWEQAAEQNLSLTASVLGAHRPRPASLAHTLSFFSRRI
jgi:phosphatidylinositol alpha-1,6-mannosyltransferase